VETECLNIIQINFSPQRDKRDALGDHNVNKKIMLKFMLSNYVCCQELYPAEQYL
jgi:hypothetical protein